MQGNISTELTPIDPLSDAKRLVGLLDKAIGLARKFKVDKASIPIDAAEELSQTIHDSIRSLEQGLGVVESTSTDPVESTESNSQVSKPIELEPITELEPIKVVSYQWHGWINGPPPKYTPDRGIPVEDAQKLPYLKCY